MAEFESSKKPKSQRPAAVAARVRSATKRVKRDLEAIVEEKGWKPVEEWDMEELARGRPRGLNGSFTGAKPGWITPAIMAEARRRHRDIISDDLKVYAQDAIKVMHELMSDQEVDYETGKPLTPPSVRMAAAKYVLDQTIGIPTQKVEVEANVKLSGLMAAVIVNPDGQPSYPGLDNVTDAELVDDEEDDSDD